jgi:hypothetical protein
VLYLFLLSHTRHRDVTAAPKSTQTSDDEVGDGGRRGGVLNWVVLGVAVVVII